jgi:hypothetical protein
MSGLLIEGEWLPDGVHLGLSHKPYFAQEAMGSSDWTKISQSGLGWWWSSRWNHFHEAAPNAATNYGSALHVIILEGVAAYERAYAVLPDKGAYADLLVTEDDIKGALARAGWDVVTGKSKWKKPDWVREGREKLDQPIWDALLQDFDARAGDRGRVSAGEDRMLRFMRDMLLSERRSDNAEIRRLLAERDDHPPLVEVSVFATIDGVRRRWRFDRMFPALTLDLKSLSGWQGWPLAYEVGEVMARRRWGIQRADYDIGRETAYELVRAGQVFGGTIEQRRYLERIVAEEARWDFAWLAYQKPDSVRGVAPILMPIWDDRDSDLARSGAARLKKAIRLYKEAVEEFGLDQPWGRVERLHYTVEGREPRIFVPHWDQNVDDPSDAEAYEENNP